MGTRRQFENSFVRRGGGGMGGMYDERHGGEEQYGGGGYEDYGGYDQDDRAYDRVPRDGQVGQRGVAGGWRQRSPSPRFRGMQDGGGDRVSRMGGGVGGGGAWNRGQEQYIDNSQQQMAFEQPQQQNLFQTNAILRNPTGSLLGQPETPLVMVLPQAQANAASLMGNLGMVQAQNQLGMFGQQVLMPGFNQSAFGQQVLGAGTPFGQGVGEQGLSSIYGPQTQQPLNRFDSSSRSRDFGRSGPSRRSENSRNDSSSNNRKRNLIPRDPRPEDNKRPRHSGTNANRGNNNSNNKRHSGVARTLSQLKRQSGAGGGEAKPKVASPKKKSDAGNKSAPASSSNAKDIVEVKDKKEEDTKTGEKKDKDRKTKFDEIPSSLLVCKVCQKAMNDGASYESHLSGRAHLALMKILEERFTKRAELLMTESKCCEDEIGIEKERQRRAGKSGRAEKNSNNYCKMCDCNYTINWGTHKVSLGHRVLKEFLHPTCRFCKAHFMHRIDWVNHMLSSPHLKKLADLKAAGTMTEGNGPTLEDQETVSQDELFAVYVDLARDERPTNALTVRSIDGKQSLTEEMKDILKNDRGEIILPEGEIPIPETFVENGEPIGEEAIVEVSGSRCRVCRVYIPEDKDKEEHCKTKDHFQNYVSFLKRVMRYREHKQAEKKAAEEKLKKEKEAKSEKNQAENGDKGTDEGMDVENEACGDVEGEEEENDMVVLDQVDGEDDSQDGVEGTEKTEETKEAVDETETVEEVTAEAKTAEKEAPGDGDAVEDNLPQGEVVGEEQVQGEEEEESWPQIVSVEGNKEQIPEAESKAEEATANTKPDVLETNDTNVALEAEVAIVEEKAEEIVPEEKKTQAASPGKATRGGGGGPRGRGSAVRGTPFSRGGRGGNQTPASALKNVAPRVDSNIRGGGARGGTQRGGRPPRGSPRGGGGPRGGRGGRGGYHR